MAQQLKINVSFKQKEIELFLFLKNMRSPGTYIKDAVEFYRKYNGKLIQFVEEESVEEKKIASSPPPNMDKIPGGELDNLLSFD